MIQQRVGHSQIAFGVLEVDGVDLVRHGRGTDFAGHGSLTEIADGDVAPKIAAEIQQHGVGPHHRVEKFRHVVVRLDLNGIGVPVQPQILGHEAAGKLLPIQFRVCRQMGVVVADRAVDLAQQRHRRQLRPLTFETIGDIGHLLAERGRRGRLAMSPRQHGLVGVLVRQSGDGVDALVQRRQQRLGPRLAQHQRIGQIVDVFGGTGEMDEFADRFQFGVAGDFFLEQILDRLHVVVGGALDVLDPLGVRQAKVLDQPAQDMEGVLAQRRHFRDAGMTGQRLQPAHLHPYPMADQAVFAEDRPQLGGLVGIAPVDGGNRGQSGKFHGSGPL